MKIRNALIWMICFITSLCIMVIIEVNPIILETGILSDSLTGQQYNVLRCDCPVLLFYGLIVAFLMYFVFLKKEYLKKTLCVCALMFGVIQTVAINIYYFDVFVCNELKYIFYDLFCSIAHGIVFYIVGLFLLILLRLLKQNLMPYKKFELWDKYASLFSFAIIFFCWLPWLLIFYPGSMWFDMCYQLEQYYGYSDYNLHPVFVTWVMGLCLEIGKIVFNSDNVGVFIYILLQSTVCAFAYSKVVVYLKDLKVPLAFQFFVLGFYAVLPIFGAFAQMGDKGVISYGLITLFIIATIKCYKIILAEDQNLFFKNLILYIFGGVLCSLYRKEMIIICLGTILLLSITALLKKRKRNAVKLIMTCCMMFVLYVGFNTVVVEKIMGIEFGGGYNSAEALSIPLQQVARFVYYKPDDVSDNEKQVLEECFWYGYEGIAGNYNPYLSDPIKGNFNNSKKKEFYRVWFSLFKKDPAIFVESLIAGSYGYYSIVPRLPSTVHDAPTNGTPGRRFEFYINRAPDLENNIVNIMYRQGTDEVRSNLSLYAYSWEKYPILDLFYSLGFYTWVLILLAICLIENKKMSYLLVFVPSLMLVAACIASPVNDHMRYFVGVIASVPLLAGVTYHAICIDGQEN